jgi:AmiR/NasT family two-component response regulator
MHSRAVLEQAKGIIMAERRCTADEAFAILTKLAEYSDREIHDVAAELTDAAVRPLKG